MLRNFFIVTLRSLKRNALYSTINIVGLSVGIVCSILILLWVQHETSYDSFHSKSDRLYQLWVNAEFDGRINSWRSVPLPTYQALKSANANIANTSVADWGGDHLLTVNEIRLTKQGYYVGEEFLEMFDFPIIQGQPDQVLDDPSSIVITEGLAKLLFPNQEAMGQLVKVDNEHSLKVSGILKDIPSNSSFEFDFLLPYGHWKRANEWVGENEQNWGNYSFQVFVELQDPTQFTETEGAISSLLTENGEDDMPRFLFLHPMPRWRLFSDFKDGKATSGMNDYVQLFSFIAVFILLMACINFMNLATARSEKRAREVGIRKSLGSFRSQLIGQFIGESVFIALIAMILALVAAELVLPAYNILVEKDLTIDYSSPEVWGYLIGIVLFTGIISGSYPALYLSSFSPSQTLKGTVVSGKGATTPRKVLVIAQFSFSILLMIATVVIYQQIELVKNRDLGYNQANLITIEITKELLDSYEPLKQELLQSGAVEAVTMSNSPITSIHSNNFLGWPGKPESLKVLFTTISAHYDYSETMGVKVLEGRDFSEEFATDTGAIVINKAALDLMKLENPIGTRLDLWGDTRTLIGVVDNVLMGSPYDAVKPMFMILNEEWISYITVRLKQGNATDRLASVQSIFEKYNPAYPFEFTFVDAEFQKKFVTIEMTRKLGFLFSLLAILITGLGLFGLASYMAEQRTKEIGIRKVMGASTFSLVLLMSKEFTRFVVISFILAAPTAWYLLDQYLDRYPIRVSIAWWIFPFVGLVALFFALAIVSNQARKVAQSNPVRALRNE